MGAGGVSYSFINEDAEADKLAAIPEAVHAEGGLVLLQLFHAGRYAFEKSFGLQPVAPSAVYSKYSRCEPRALSEEEIVATIEDFASGARTRARARLRRCRDHGLRGLPAQPVHGAGDEPARRRLGRRRRAADAVPAGCRGGGA